MRYIVWIYFPEMAVDYRFKTRQEAEAWKEAYASIWPEYESDIEEVSRE